jgi:hypothetical protein
MPLRDDARRILDAALAAADPREAVLPFAAARGRSADGRARTVELGDVDRVLIVGAGKGGGGDGARRAGGARGRRAGDV